MVGKKNGDFNAVFARVAARKRFMAYICALPSILRTHVDRRRRSGIATVHSESPKAPIAWVI